MSKNLTTADTIIPAWFMAATNRPIKEDLIFHLDRGVQYAFDDFTEILKLNGFIQ